MSNALRCLSLSCLLLAIFACQPVSLNLRPTTHQAPDLALQLRLKWPIRQAFQLLAPSQPEEVASLRFCLLLHATGSSLAGAEQVTPFGPVFSYAPNGAANVSLSFGNLVANASGMSYSVAVAAFDAEGQNITNQTGDNASQQRVTLAGETGNFYLSTLGGDPLYPGSVHISAGSYALSGHAPLGLLLKLADG